MTEADSFLTRFAAHPVAGNLLMVLMILVGIWGISQLSRQLMPEFSIENIEITILWPGASPEDVESNVLEALEPEVRFLDRVDQVRSLAYEGRASVTLVFLPGTNMSKALTDVQAAVARVTSFPEDIERPLVSQVMPSDAVCRIQISGPFPEAALKRVARRVRDDLLDRGLAKVDILGARDSEILVEVPESALRSLGLTLNDVADRIAGSSLDLPAGSLESGETSQQIRTEARARSVSDLETIEIVARSGGERVLLRDVARIREGFEENAVSHRVDSGLSIGLKVTRLPGMDSITSQRTVEAYLEELRPTLPPTLQVEQFDIFANQVSDRITMLVQNGLGGLLLVLGVLYLFLSARFAFWVAAGIPIAFLAALGAMAALGLSLNLISMFALIMGLGIVVDDAIVVGEHTATLHRRGATAEEAVTRTIQKMWGPVLAASLTTMAAFLPVLMIGGTVGEIIAELPITLILVIIASLVECFLVLPMHLRASLAKADASGGPRISGFHQAFNRFRDGPFRKITEAAFRYRYSTVMATICAAVLALSVLASGRVAFDFFPATEEDLVFGNFAASPGTSREFSEQMVVELRRAARAAEAELTNGEGGLINFAFGSIATAEGRNTQVAGASGDHLGAYTIELISGDQREVRTSEFVAAWKREVEPLAGVEQLVFFQRAGAGPPGRDLDIRLAGADLETLKAAALDMREALFDLPGVTAVEDDMPFGKQEVLIAVTPAGKALGFSNRSVATQVRNAFEGAIAQRFSRDGEEVVIKVKRPESVDLPQNLRALYLRAPNGEDVPLAEVATLTRRVGFAQIRREDGLRQISVTADVDATVSTSNAVLAVVERDVAPSFRARGIDVIFKGRAEEQAKALADLQLALMLALATMFVILAWVFSSYTLPLVVMSIIPFGVIGAIVGHWALGLNMNLFSLVALLGLSGVMVNDSIILVAAIRRRIERGLPLTEAISDGTRERLRPVILTTLTTVVGLVPILFEGSLQAQLVQPMATTVVFGLLFSPFLVLLFVPALLGVGADLLGILGRRQTVPVTASGEL